jgi:hypothetical protein
VSNCLGFFSSRGCQVYFRASETLHAPHGGVLCNQRPQFFSSTHLLYHLPVMQMARLTTKGCDCKPHQKGTGCHHLPIRGVSRLWDEIFYQSGSAGSITHTTSWPKNFCDRSHTRCGTPCPTRVKFPTFVRIILRELSTEVVVRQRETKYKWRILLGFQTGGIICHRYFCSITILNRGYNLARSESIPSHANPGT